MLVLGNIKSKRDGSVICKELSQTIAKQTYSGIFRHTNNDIKVNRPDIVIRDHLDVECIRVKIYPPPQEMMIYF